MLSPDLLRRAELNPDALTPTDHTVIGISFIQAAADKASPFKNQADRMSALHNGIDVARGGLADARTDSRYSERERLALAVTSINAIPWKELEPTIEVARLWADSMLTLGTGLKTQIDKRKEELFGEITDGFYRLGASLTLGKQADELTAVEQVRALKNSDKFTSEQRREVSLVWARTQAGTIPNEEFLEIVEDFADDNDQDAVMQLTRAMVQSLIKNP